MNYFSIDILIIVTLGHLLGLEESGGNPDHSGLVSPRVTIVPGQPKQHLNLLLICLITRSNLCTVWQGAPFGAKLGSSSLKSSACWSHSIMHCLYWFAFLIGELTKRDQKREDK